MQTQLQAAVGSRRRRRTAVRWSVGALAAALLAAVMWPTPEADLGSAPVVALGASPREQQVALRHCEYGVVRDDASVLQRFTVASAPVPAETWVDDEQLVELLSAAGRPTGLIRTPEKVVLIYDVVDTIGE